jgi:hypothetical protein
MGSQKEKKETKEPMTYWFVEPEDAHTNEVIAKSLLALSQLDENVALEDVDGASHSVYQVEEYFFITRLYRDRAKLSLRFTVFYRAGKNGKLRFWKLGVKKPQTQIKTVIRVKSKM